MGPRIARRTHPPLPVLNRSHSKDANVVMAQPDTRTLLARRYAFLLAVAAVVIALDQLAKALVTSHLRGQAPIRLLNGALYLDYIRNSGAAFSMLPSGGLLFELVAIAVSVGILLLYVRVA